MRSAVALVASLAMLSGCFPDNARHRTIAKVVEGGFVVGGIVMLAAVNTGADCMPDVAGMPDKDCEDQAKLISSIGLAIVLTGLIGFITTVSTSPDDKPDPPATQPPPAPQPPPPAPVPASTTIATPPGETPPTTPAPEPTPPTEPAPEQPTTPPQ